LDPAALPEEMEVTTMVPDAYVKPGLSCFWQIKPERNSIKFEKWMEMDLAYIDNWSLRLDFVILLKTLKTIFQRSGI
jgi:lipopolysaccharide/colanic/teichoic acid biosynthesis glycosyltransferase